VTRQTKRFIGCLVVLVLGLAGLGYVGLRDRGPGNAAISELSTAVAPAGASASPGPEASADATAAAATAAAKAKAAEAKATEAKAKAAKAKPVIVKTVVSTKKGAGIWKEDGITKAMSDSGVSWFYNWAADKDGVTGPSGVEFVPMIWGANSATTSTLATAKKNGTVLLGFNEPDLGGQANMSVDAALDLWPKLEATNMRLGSPAVAWGADRSGQWLDRFMTGARQRGYRVDFITLHWYGSDFRTVNAVSQLQSYVRATYAKYHKPIWITEYALMNFTGSPKIPSVANQADFVTKSTAMLQRLSYVERYAWFAFPTSTDGTDGTGLYRPGGIATAPGKAYKAAG
jgi:Glycosyl hydrolase catalytic core